MSKQITKIINEIVSIGEKTSEGEIVVQYFQDKFHVGYYLGTGNFESFGLPYHTAEKTLVIRVKLDGDSPEYFRKYKRESKQQLREKIIDGLIGCQEIEN